MPRHLNVTECPICRGTTKPFNVPYGEFVEITCDNCGTYSTSDSFIVDSRAGLSVNDGAHVSAWIRDRWRRGEKTILVAQPEIEAILKNVSRPTPAEKAHRLLLMLARLSNQPGEEIPRDMVRPSDAWAASPAELVVYARWLLDRDYLSPYAESGRYCLTLPGWAEVDRLQHQRSATGRRSFVAMAFHESMDAAWKEGLEPGVLDANFAPFRMKEEIHTERIDARIIAELRACRFAIADVTLNRSAVYYEAGFAQALGKVVIWTCRADRASDMCFDTRQFLHILWKDPADLRRQLKPVITALIV